MPCNILTLLSLFSVLAVLSWVCCITFNIWRAMRFAMRGDIADERLLGSREWCVLVSFSLLKKQRYDNEFFCHWPLSFVCLLVLFVPCVCRCYHLISWGVPLVVATLPFSEGVYGPAGPWWWVITGLNRKNLTKERTVSILKNSVVLGKNQ